MSETAFEKRLTRLEAEVEQLKKEKSLSGQQPWWEHISGVFKDDPLFDEAEQLGREWRDAQREPEDANSRRFPTT